MDAEASTTSPIPDSASAREGEAPAEPRLASSDGPAGASPSQLTVLQPDREPPSGCNAPGPYCRGSLWFFGLVAIALTAIVFRQVKDFQFLNWDDDQHVVNNPHFNPITWTGLLEFWHSSFIFLYIPVSYMFFAAEAWISQWFPTGDPAVRFNPAVFHIGNLLVHLAATALVYRILLKLVPVPAAAMVGALVFSIHPLQAECVSWIGETRGTLCSLFLLASWWFYLKGAGIDAERGILAEVQPPAPRFRLRDYIFATICFAAALLSKPSAVPWPAVVLVLDVLLLRRSFAGSAARTALWFAGSITLAALTKWYQSTDIVYPPSVLTWDLRPRLMGDTYAFYLLKIVSPTNLGFDYGRTPQYAVATPTFDYAWLLPVGLGLVLLALPRRRIWLSAYALFIILILPVSGAVPFLYQAISTTADRYMHLSLFGAALAVTAFLASRRRPTAWFAATCLLLGLSAQYTYEQTGTWRNDETMFNHGLNVTPTSYMAHYTLGNVYRGQGRYDAAVWHFRKALDIRPDYVYARYYRSECLVHLGRLRDAASELEGILQLSPRYYGALVMYGEVLSKQGNDFGADDAFSRAIAESPQDPQAYLSWGIARLEKLQFAEAKALFDQAASLSPTSADVAGKIGRAWLDAERYAEASAALEKAVELNGDSAQNRADLSGCYLRLGKYAPAVEQAAAAAKLDPRNFQAHYHLGLALSQIGRPKDALAHFEQARRLTHPGTTEAAGVRKAIEELRLAAPSTGR